jgi:hypothetical protein
MPLRVKINACIEIDCVPCPPRGVTGVSSKQTKGQNMAADVQVLFTPDSDPNVVQSVTTFNVNGNPVGSVTLGPAGAMAAYSAITPAPPPLAVGDVVTGGIVTTDNQTPPQNSPNIPFPQVTIAAAPPPPQGVTNVTSKQVGTP